MELYKFVFKLATTTVTTVKTTTTTTATTIITTTTTTITSTTRNTIDSWAIVVMCMVYMFVQNTPAAPLVFLSYGVKYHGLSKQQQ
jgi:hypothetical protein